MTATTRPLYPLHVDILGQVHRLGGATSGTIEGCGEVAVVGVVLRYLQRQGYLSSVWRLERRGTRNFRIGFFELTEKGRAALETGLVPLLVNPPTSFNNRNLAHGKVRVAQACQHYWDVGPPPVQVHTCRHCKATKDQPMTYGVELSRVGGGRPRGSERYKARLLEVGVTVGRTAVDWEEEGE